MTHLTSDQFIDAIEAKVALPRAASAHLAGCDACRTEQASLADALAEARALPMLEPPPLFWDHFSQRVRAATSDEPVPRATVMGWLGLRGGWSSFATIAFAVSALVLAVVMRSARSVDDSGRGAVPTVAALTPAAGPSEAVGVDDGGLSVVAALAADLKTEDLQQVARPSADATGAAIENLTPAQCAEMIRLIKTQMSGAE